MQGLHVLYVDCNLDECQSVLEWLMELRYVYHC